MDIPSLRPSKGRNSKPGRWHGISNGGRSIDRNIASFRGGIGEQDEWMTNIDATKAPCAKPIIPS
jgi:hypothetical protein